MEVGEGIRDGVSGKMSWQRPWGVWGKSVFDRCVPIHVLMVSGSRSFSGPSGLCPGRSRICGLPVLVCASQLAPCPELPLQGGALMGGGGGRCGCPGASCSSHPTCNLTLSFSVLTQASPLSPGTASRSHSGCLPPDVPGLRSLTLSLADLGIFPQICSSSSFYQGWRHHPPGIGTQRPRTVSLTLPPPSPAHHTQ